MKKAAYLRKRNRPRTPSERRRASEIRSRLRDGVFVPKRDVRWLESYERAKERYREWRAKLPAWKRPTPKSRRSEMSARKRAEQLAGLVGAWLGGPGTARESHWVRPPKPNRPGSAVATSTADWNASLGPPGALRLPKQDGRSINIRALVRHYDDSGDGWDTWITLSNLTRDWANAAADAEFNVGLLARNERPSASYEEATIVAVSVYVAGYR